MRVAMETSSSPAAMTSEPGALGGRRRKTAAERRAQRRRSEARAAARLLAGLVGVSAHRGGALSKAGDLLRAALVAAAAPPRAPPSGVRQEGGPPASPGGQARDNELQTLVVAESAPLSSEPVLRSEPAPPQRAQATLSGSGLSFLEEFFVPSSRPTVEDPPAQPRPQAQTPRQEPPALCQEPRHSAQLRSEPLRSEVSQRPGLAGRSPTPLRSEPPPPTLAVSAASAALTPGASAARAEPPAGTPSSCGSTLSSSLPCQFDVVRVLAPGPYHGRQGRIGLIEGERAFVAFHNEAIVPAVDELVAIRDG